MKRRIFGPVAVVRESPGDARGAWWVMNHREKGWSSFGYPHPSLADVLEKWAVKIVGAGTDKHGSFVEIAPLAEGETAPAFTIPEHRPEIAAFALQPSGGRLRAFEATRRRFRVHVLDHADDEAQAAFTAYLAFLCAALEDS